MSKKPALGKGLDSIFADNASFTESTADRQTVVQLKLTEIEPNSGQPRKSFDRESLDALADSIAANGVIQPILVRDKGNGFFGIIAGERRWRASKQAGLSEIPAIIMEADDLKSAKLALIENIQREDLNPYDEAEGYRELIDIYNVTHEELSTSLGKSRSAITNSLRLLDLPQDVLEMLRGGQVSAGHGRALLGLKDKSQISPLALKAAQRNLSVREIETAVRSSNRAYENEQKESGKAQQPVTVDWTKDLETRITKRLGHRVRIYRSGARRHVEIDFAGNDEFEEIIRKLCGEDFFDDER